MLLLLQGGEEARRDLRAGGGGAENAPGWEVMGPKYVNKGRLVTRTQYSPLSRAQLRVGGCNMLIF